MFSNVYITSFVIGCLVHILVFSRNEWDRRAPAIFSFFCALYIGSFALLKLGLGYTIKGSLLQTSALGCVLLGGLFTSLVIYRLFFHPLRAFPGPIGARITAFWSLKESTPDLKFYLKLQKLHDQYGDFVRIRKH